MDVTVKMARLQIKQNVLNLKSTLDHLAKGPCYYTHALLIKNSPPQEGGGEKCPKNSSLGLLMTPKYAIDRFSYR